MKVYVYCPRNSDSARDLTAALVTAEVDATRIRTEAGLAKARRRPGVILAWGAKVRPATTTEVVLNANPLKNKLVELEKMRAANVIVPDFSRTRPRQVETATDCNNCPCRTPHRATTRTNDGEWLGRKLMHQSANDLRRPGTFIPDFYVKKLDMVEEFRIHIFKGKSIRLGKKTAHPGAHAWIRSGETGWWIDYGDAWRQGYSQRNLAAARNAAKAAVAALGLDFGAVDLGRTIDGRFVVFEVNTAPSLSTPATATTYAAHVKEFVSALARR